MVEDRVAIFDPCWNRVGVLGHATRSCPRLKTVIHCHHCPVFASAGQHLFDRPLPDDYRQELTAVWAEPPARETGETVGAFAFCLAGERLAVPAATVREVLQMGKVHRLPGRNLPALLGLTPVHGRLQLCFSLAATLGIAAGQGEKGRYGQWLVLAAVAGERFVFPVDQALGMVRYHPADLAEPPVTVSNARRRFTRGVIVLDGQDHALLDIQAIYGELRRGLG